MLERYDALVVAGREAELEHKEARDALMVAGREADRRLVAAIDCERTLKGIREENEQPRAETQASPERAFQEGRSLHVKSEKQEQQVSQLQQRISTLTQKVHTSAAGAAQSLEAFNQKEDLMNKLSERLTN